MERGFLWLAEVLFLIALGCFLRAFSLRKQTPRHRRWAGSGALIVVAGLVVLEVLKRGFGWEFPVRSTAVLHWHIGFASASLLLLAVQTLTGILHWRRVHAVNGPIFLGTFATTVVLSFFAFRLW